MLEGIEHDQRLTSCERSLDQEGDAFADLNHAERLGDRRRHELRVVDLSQGDKEHAVRKCLLLRRGDGQRKAGFAHAPRPGQGDQKIAGILQRGGYFRHLVSTTEDWGWGDGERTSRRLEQAPGTTSCDYLKATTCVLSEPQRQGEPPGRVWVDGASEPTLHVAYGPGAETRALGQLL